MFGLTAHELSSKIKNIHKSSPGEKRTTITTEWQKEKNYYHNWDLKKKIAINSWMKQILNKNNISLLILYLGSNLVKEHIHKTAYSFFNINVGIIINFWFFVNVLYKQKYILIHFIKCIVQFWIERFIVTLEVLEKHLINIHLATLNH